MALIGIGSSSKYNIYIIVAAVFKLISDSLLGLNPLNKKHPGAILNFIPLLNNHRIFQNCLDFLGFAIGGILIYYLFQNINKKFVRTHSEISDSETSYNIKKIYFEIVLVAIFFSTDIILRKFLYSNFLNLELWMIEIVFMALFTRKILKIEINRHQKVAILSVTLIIIINFINKCLPETYHKNKSDNEEYMSDYNIFQNIGKKIGYYYIPILSIALLSLTVMRDYSWVKSKYLIDKKDVSLSRMLFITGIIGLFLSIISFIISSYSPCKTYNNVIKGENNNYFIDNKLLSLSREICFVQDYDNDTKTLKLYYDSFFVMAKEYRVFSKEVKLELFIILPLFLITTMIKNSCNMIIIKYLEGYHILISDNLYFFTNRLIVFILNKANEEYLTIVQFILRELCESIYIIINLVYIEIIELKFCGLDYDLKKNIQERSKVDSNKENESELGINLVENDKENQQIEMDGGYIIVTEDFNKGNELDN